VQLDGLLYPQNLENICSYQNGMSRLLITTAIDKLYSSEFTMLWFNVYLTPICQIVNNGQNVPGYRAGIY